MRHSNLTAMAAIRNMRHAQPTPKPNNSPIAVPAHYLILDEKRISKKDDEESPSAKP